MAHHPAPPHLDHRELNRDLAVFATDPLVGSGLPLWLPDGAVIRAELERLAREIARRDGCVGVYSPVLGKRALYERSGHWAKFADDMFPPMRLAPGDAHAGPDGAVDHDPGPHDPGPDDLVLRPANCPHHALVYASQPHSHRDLPLRVHELAPMFRAERSGVLSGLSRVRQISLDDTHVFCRPDQVAAEVARAVRSALGAQRVLGLPVDHVRLSRRGAGDGWLGAPERWEAAEAALRAAAAEVLVGDDARPLVDGPGEAAFYGPKLDLQVHDGRGHEETIATVQVDLHQPEAFGLRYDAADGSRPHVVMVHRGTVGSMERVVAALLERYQGRLPLWLAPVQVRVLPVGPDQDDAARGIADDLAAAGLRCRVEPEGSLGARIRAARRRRDAVLAVVGPAEAASGSVQVTDVAAGFRGAVGRAALVEVLVRAYAARDAVVGWPGAAG